MTQDELEAWLLLAGFVRTPTRADIRGDAFRLSTADVWIWVQFNTNQNNVRVLYTEISKKAKLRTFNTNPEAAFNFIRKRLT